LVGIIQLAALGYGLYNVALARPVYLVFQVNDFRAVIAADVDPNKLPEGPVGLQSLPWTGPKTICTRQPIDDKDRMDATSMALGGQEISMRPSWWRPYEACQAEILALAKPMAQLKERRPSDGHLIDEAVAKTGAAATEVLWLPLVSRQSTDWIVLLDKNTSAVKGYAHIDGYEMESNKP
jgi:hypothetical protein